MAIVQTPMRGEVWLVDFDPAVGAEIRMARPAVVVSVDSVGRLPQKVSQANRQSPHYVIRL